MQQEFTRARPALPKPGQQPAQSQPNLCDNSRDLVARDVRRVAEREQRHRQRPLLGPSPGPGLGPAGPWEGGPELGVLEHGWRLGVSAGYHRSWRPQCSSDPLDARSRRWGSQDPPRAPEPRACGRTRQYSVPCLGWTSKGWVGNGEGLHGSATDKEKARNKPSRTDRTRTPGTCVLCNHLRWAGAGSARRSSTRLRQGPC